MEITPKMQEYLDNCPSFSEHFAECFKDKAYIQAWLEMALNNFINNGDVDEFVNCLIEVVKHGERGSITRIASNAGINRANLHEIISGRVTPRIDTAFKLIKGLGFECDIKLKLA